MYNFNTFKLYGHIIYAVPRDLLDEVDLEPVPDKNMQKYKLCNNCIGNEYRFLCKELPLCLNYPETKTNKNNSVAFKVKDYKTFQATLLLVRGGNK